MSSIPFEKQYFVERDRNNKFEWSLFALAMGMFAGHGVLFHWVPRYIRSRNHQSRTQSRYFRFVRYWDLWTGCFSVKVGLKTIFYQPSVVLLGLIYLMVVALFCFIQTIDLDYQVRFYIVAKRILTVAMGNLPTIMIMVIRNDVVGFVSGLQHDRLTFVHKWISRLMWVMISVHLGMCISYWLNLNFPVMITIPPQIFGMIGYGCFCILTWGSLRCIRKWSYDFFLIMHRVANFIMMLMILFHSPTSKTIVIISIHMLVLDKVATRVRAGIHKKKSPSKSLAEFEILDEETYAVTIAVRNIGFELPRRWYHYILPGCQQWRVGQHIYLNVGKVKYFQYHPFTICSLSETGEMRLVIRKQRGFTKNLLETLFKMQENPQEEKVSLFKKFATKLSKNQGDQKVEVKSGLAPWLKSFFRNSSDIKLNDFTNGQTTKDSTELSDITFASTDREHEITYADTKEASGSLSKQQDFSSTNSEQVFGSASSSTPISLHSMDAQSDSSKLRMKVTFHGPYGAHYQPFIKFDYSLFIGAGSGASFTLPVALDLLNIIKAREEVGDFLHRPKCPIVHVVWIIRKLKNMIWYQDLLDEIMVYVSNDRAKLDVYVTQEAEPNELENSFLKGNMDVVSTTSGSDYSLCGKYYYRPEVADIIAESSSAMKDTNGEFKSLAVSACGPEVLTSTVKAECVKNRRVADAPDIYCYTETF